MNWEAIRAIGEIVDGGRHRNARVLGVPSEREHPGAEDQAVELTKA